MRDLIENEAQYVTGAGCSPCPPTKPVKCPRSKEKGNNGFGNGGHDGSNAGFQDSTR